MPNVQSPGPLQAQQFVGPRLPNERSKLPGNTNFFFSGSAKNYSSQQRSANSVRELDGTSIIDVSTEGGKQNFIHFQSMPTEISDSKLANWTPTTILGRSEPIQGYSDSGPRTVSFSLEFAASVDQGDQSVPLVKLDEPGTNVEFSPTNYVLEAVAWLQSLVYPDYDDTVSGLVKPPPVCVLIIGELIRMRCICKDVNVSWRGPWEPSSLTPMFATVALNFDEVNENRYGEGPWGYKQVRDRSNFTAASSAGTRNNFKALI